MIINKTLITFVRRVPSPRYVPVGVVGDNLVECVEFRLPTIDTDQTATMLLKCKYADAIALMRTDAGTYCADITAQIAGESGRLEAYIRIDGAGGAVWNSEPFMLCVCNVPDISGDIEDQEPGALEQTLSAIAAHNASMKQHGEAMEELTESASESAESAAAAAKRAEAAAERAENAGDSGGSGSGVQTVNGKAPDDNGNIEVREVPEGAGSYQQLVTGADGVAKWEANPLYKTDRLTLKLSPAFDKAGSSGKYIGCAATNDAAQRAVAMEIGGAIPKKDKYSKSGYTFFWDGVKYVASFRALPFVWTKGSSIGMKDGTTHFPFDATCVSANGGANLNITYDDGQDHTFEWVLAEPKAKPLDEEWIPTTVPVIQTAEAGQVVTVKSVDENGKPTEWEATNTDNLKGEPGEPGRDGQDGKTAYQYAQDGGYTGTEAEFAAKLAQELPEPYTLPVATADRLGGVKVGKGLTMDGEALGVRLDGYELIRRISIDTDVKEINMTHEPDGTECRYTNVLVRIGYNSSSHVAGKWVRATVYLADGTSVNAFRINSDSANLKGWQLVKTCRENGYTSIEISNPTVNEGNITTSSAPMRAIKQILSSADIVRVVLDRENAFMANDVIEIYGVRA